MEEVLDRPVKRMARWLGIGGVTAIVFGVTLLLWPGISLQALTALFGAFAFVYGAFAMGAGLSLLAHRSTEWAPYVVGGAAGVLLGVVTFLHPAVTELTLAFLIAAFAFVAGVFQIIAATDMWGDTKDAIWFGISGVVSIVFGALVVWHPGAGLLAFVWMIGVYAIAVGIAQLVGSYRIYQVRREAKGIATGSARPTQPTHA